MNISAASFTNAIYSEVALNPQPLPPSPTPFGSSLWNSAIASQSQPAASSAALRSNSLWNAINPQPLPPGSASNAGTQNGIIVVGGRGISLDDYCGNGNGKPPIPHIGLAFGQES